MAKSTFQFPDFYDMHPFFTIQPVVNTRKKQLELWGELILDYSKHHKKYEFDLTEVAKTPLFNNTKINRKISGEGIKLIFEELVSQGNGEWQDKGKNRITIYWRRPEEWASLIYKWVASHGTLTTVVTVSDLQEGEETEKEDFHKLETKILIKALEALERQQKAQIFTASSSDNLGVKFFSV